MESEGLRTLIPVVTGLLGVLVGGLVSEWRQWLQLRRERRAALSRVLYAQMDMWFSVAGVDAQAVFDALPRVVARASGASESDLRQALVATPGLESLLRDLFTGSVPPQLSERYQAAVDALAAHEPILAYELSGRADVPAMMEAAQARIVAFGAPTNTPADQPLLDALNPALAAESRKKVAALIEGDIHKVAKSISRTTLRSARATVARVKKNVADTAGDEVSSRVRELMTRVGLLRAAT